MSSATARVFDFSRAQAILADSELGVRRASALERPSPEMVPTGVPAIDALTGGLPRGGLTEIVGPASSGRTSLLLSILAQATARQEACALVDASDAFDPESAVSAGVDLKRLLWVRCRVPSETRVPGPNEPRVPGPFPPLERAGMLNARVPGRRDLPVGRTFSLLTERKKNNLAECRFCSGSSVVLVEPGFR
jgi:recA bacterial DNA recombination protein